MAQLVHLSRTQSGTLGFFTGNFLAFSLDKERFARALEDKEYAKQLARKLGFELMNSNVEVLDGNPTTR